MFEGKGYFKGASVLLGGGAGTGKTSVAAHFADAACRRGERCLFFSFEESPSQLTRNMRSIGIDLQPWIDGGLLRCHAARPSLQGLEPHLASMIKDVDDFKPHAREGDWRRRARPRGGDRWSARGDALLNPLFTMEGTSTF